MKKFLSRWYFVLVLLIFFTTQATRAQQTNSLMEVPAIQSSWDDLLTGVKTQDEWHQRRAILKKRYLDLLRDQFKPEKPEEVSKTHLVNEKK